MKPRYQRARRDAGKVGLRHWATMYGKPPPQNEATPETRQRSGAEETKQREQANSPTNHTGAQDEDRRFGAPSPMVPHLLPTESVHPNLVREENPCR